MAVLQLLFVGAILFGVCDASEMKNAVYKAPNGKNCIMCNQGEFVKEHCNASGHQSTCAKCPEGEYNPGLTQATSCTSCNETCPPSQEVLEVCSRTQNLQCRPRDDADATIKVEESGMGTGSGLKSSAFGMAVIMVATVAARMLQ